MRRRKLRGLLQLRASKNQSKTHPKSKSKSKKKISLHQPFQRRKSSHLPNKSTAKKLRISCRKARKRLQPKSKQKPLKAKTKNKSI